VPDDGDHEFDVFRDDVLQPTDRRT